MLFNLIFICSLQSAIKIFGIMKQTIFLITFFLIISVLINLSFIFDKVKNGEGLVVDETEYVDDTIKSECVICKLFIRDLNSHWYAQNGLSRDEVITFLDHYAKSLPFEMENTADKFISENKQFLIQQIISGKPPYPNICGSLLGCD